VVNNMMLTRQASLMSAHSGDNDWAAVRAAYPKQLPLLNLNNAAVSPPPLIVEQAVIDAFRLISHNPDVNMEQARRRTPGREG
jgi:hypothetical protein